MTATARPSLVAAFVAAFATSVSLWWLYFDRSAEEGAEVFAASRDPGRLGRSAYHLIHPVMVAGIIVAAAADELVLSHPGAPVDGPTAWMVLAGPALFLAGHATFKRAVWQVVPWTRLAAIGVLVALAALAGQLTAVWLSVVAGVVVIAVAATDRVLATTPVPG